jgi:hypothetical protein
MRALRTITLVCVVTFIIASSSSPCDWDYLIWIPRSADADPLFRFINADKVGYIDKTGKIVVPPVIPFTGGNDGGEFHAGLLETGIGDGVYLNTSAAKAIDKKLYRGWDFSEGLAVAREKEGGKWGYINTKGEFAISPRFGSSPKDYVWPFEGGFAKIEVAGRFGYIDHTGAFVVPPKFIDGDSFHEGMARVVVEGPCTHSEALEENPCLDLRVVPKGTNTQGALPACKYAFIDKSGSMISEQRYDYALPFAEGLAPVRIGKSWGYIDKAGATAIAPRFDSAASFSNGLGLVSENGLFGYVDHTGAYVIKPQFKRAETFAEGRAVAGDDQPGYWYIDRHGKQAFPSRFALASPFFKGLAHVKILSGLAGTENIHVGTFAYIDSTGRTVFEYKQ